MVWLAPVTTDWTPRSFKYYMTYDPMAWNALRTSASSATVAD